MATPSINGNDFPTSLAGRGYTFYPQELTARTGSGLAVPSGPQRAVWRYRVLTPAELDWWVTTVLGGARSVQITTAELWDDRGNPVTFTDGVLYEPEVGRWWGGLYWDVVVRAEHLLPIVR